MLFFSLKNSHEVFHLNDRFYYHNTDNIQVYSNLSKYQQVIFTLYTNFNLSAQVVVFMLYFSQKDECKEQCQAT